MGDVKNDKTSHIYSVTRRKDKKVVDASCIRSTAAFINHNDVPNVELDDIWDMVVCGVEDRGPIQVTDHEFKIVMTIPWSLLQVLFLDKKAFGS